MTRPPRHLTLVAAALTGLAGAPALAQGGAPLSAIDWLSESLREDASAPAAAPARPPARPVPAATPDTGSARRRPAISEPPVASSVHVPAVEITPLPPVSAQAVGLFPPSARGLAGTLWAGSDPARLTDLIAATGVPALPALQDLVRDLMLAQALPPRGDSGDALLLARVDQRLEAGAVDEALALLEAGGSGPLSPALFRRRFDAALLSGQENSVCRLIDEEPTLAPSWPTRIFCLARGGDWTAAALTLGTARALGDISDAEDALLSRFLDPDLYEGEPPLPPLARPAPLEFRMREAIGQPIPTAGLPRAFSNVDLRDSAGRKFRLEAAERLARSGALPPETLLQIYLDGRASASGGVWDRVAAIQALNTALQRSDARAAAQALPAAWEAMTRARSEIDFATLWGAQLDRMALQGEAGAIAHRLGLLSPAHAAHATGDDLSEQIARGAPPQAGPNATPRDIALAEAFSGSAPPGGLIALAEADRTGEAILRAVALFELGAAGDPVALRDAVAALRALGLDPVARRAALQVLLLDRRS